MVFSKKQGQITAKQEKEALVRQQNILPRGEDKVWIMMISVANTKNQGKGKKSH
ncbi:MAG: hypothetical protein AAFX80_15960 [Cyanobacteria bacterium J06639_18]